MDIARPSNAKKKRIRQASTPASACSAVVLVSVGLSRLKPAAPTVERAVVWPRHGKRGPMVRQVRGLGTLVPEDIRWIPATTQGRVEKIILRPGTPGEERRRDPRADQPAARTGAAGRRAEAAGRRSRPGQPHACSCRTTCSQQRARRREHRGRLQQGQDAGADERGAGEGPTGLGRWC